jgi:hypothetical protein
VTSNSVGAAWSCRTARVAKLTSEARKKEVIDMTRTGVTLLQEDVQVALQDHGRISKSAPEGWEE